MPSPFRLLACCLCTLFLGFSLMIGAQENNTAESVQLTPEILAVMKSAEKTADEMTDENEKIPALFQLLTFQSRVKDKTKARQTINTILNLADRIDREQVKMQVYEAIAVIQAEIGDRTASVATLEKITKTASRADAQLNIAEMIWEADKNVSDVSPFDVTPLLQKAMAGAVEIHDKGLEALCATLLADVLAGQKKQDQANLWFLKARNLAKELESIEERNVIALIVRAQAKNNMLPQALALVDSLKEEDIHNNILGVIMLTLTENNQLDQALLMLERISDSEIKDNVLIGLGRTAVSTASPEQLVKMAKMSSTTERKELYIQNVLQSLLDAKKPENAEILLQESEHAEEYRSNITAFMLDQHIERKEYDEATKIVDSFDNDELKKTLKRHLIALRIKDETPENAQKMVDAYHSPEDKSLITQLNQERKAVAQLAGNDERLATLFGILQEQAKILDLKGLQATMEMMVKEAADAEDPAQSVMNLFLLAGIREEMNDPKGAVETIKMALHRIDQTENIMDLQGIIPDEEPEPDQGADAFDEDPTDSPLKLKLPVNEAQVKDRLFEVYLTIADQLNKLKDHDMANQTLTKATQLAESESDSSLKFEKLNQLIQLLASFQSVE